MTHVQAHTLCRAGRGRCGMKEFPNIKVTKIKIGSDACYNKDVADSTFSNLSVLLCVVFNTAFTYYHWASGSHILGP